MSFWKTVLAVAIGSAIGTFAGWMMYFFLILGWALKSI